MKQYTLKNHNVILGAGVLNFMCLGLMYSWSKFATEIREELAMDHSRVTLAYTICMAVFTVGILMDGVLGKKLSPRTCSLIGTFLTVAGYALTSCVPVENPALLYLSYGPLVGLGIGLVYNEWLSNIVYWFSDRSGLASGLLLLGMGLSGVTTTPVMAWLTQTLGWRSSFRVIALLFLVTGLFFRRYLLPVDGMRNLTPSASSRSVGLEMNSWQMLCQPCFWSFALWKLIIIGLGQACSGQLAEIVVDMNGGDLLQLAAVSLFVVCNGIARLLWGMSCDRIGRVRTMQTIAFLAVLSTSLLVFGFKQKELWITVFALLMIALCYGGGATLGANYIVSVFGKKYYRQNNGVSALTCLPVNIGATSAIGVVRTVSGSYRHIASSFCGTFGSICKYTFNSKNEAKYYLKYKIIAEK